MSAAEGQRSFRPVLGLPGLILFGIAFITPTAPFPVFGIVSSVSHGHMALAYVFAMFAMVLTALSYGRMSAAYPAAGSAYTFTRRSLHPILGFVTGWTMLLDYLLIPMLSVIYISLTAARLVPEIPYEVWIVTVAFLITAANLFGLRITNHANLVMTVIMSISVIWFVVAAVRILGASPGSASQFTWKPFYNPETFSLSTVMAGTSIAAFSFLGFDGISTLAEDTRNPRRDIGRATVLVCLIVAALFILQAYLAQSLWPDFTSYPDVDTAFLDVARLAGGDALFSLVTFVLLVAGLSSAVAGQASASRLLFGMGRDRLLPHKIFTYIHPRFSTPTFGVLTVGLVSVIGGFFFSFRLAAEAVNFGALFGFMCVNVCVVQHYFFRNAERGVSGFLRNLLLPVAGFLVCLYVFGNLSSIALWIGAIWCACGILGLAMRTRGFQTDLDALIPAEIPVE
ncbi:MAG: APC family permease [Bryobacterales bacterium]|nr:APC family permease [Bryobacterales bacterium]